MSMIPKFRYNYRLLDTLQLQSEKKDSELRDACAHLCKEASDTSGRCQESHHTMLGSR